MAKIKTIDKASSPTKIRASHQEEEASQEENLNAESPISAVIIAREVKRMSNAIEIEAKVLLREEDYAKLVAFFKGSKGYSQTNYYIDTEERILAKEGIALRIREKNGAYEMTLKTPLSEGLLEKNCPLTKEEFINLQKGGEFPEKDIKRFLLMLDIDIPSLKILTSLSTYRIDVPYEGGLLSIDKNEYSGLTDYEIELEYNHLDGAQKILKNLLSENQIPCSFSTATKVHRAMKAIGK